MVKVPAFSDCMSVENGERLKNKLCVRRAVMATLRQKSLERNGISKVGKSGSVRFPIFFIGSQLTMLTTFGTMPA